MLHFPRLLLPIFDDAATTLMQDIASNPVFLSESIPESQSSEDTGSGRKGRFSQVFQANKQFFILIRMVALPPLFELSKPTIGDIRLEEYFLIYCKYMRTMHLGVHLLTCCLSTFSYLPMCVYLFKSMLMWGIYKSVLHKYT